MAQKEKLEEAKRLYQTANADQRYVLESLFPELKELGDEKIRKALVELVKCNERSGYTLLNNVSTSSMLSWLEKQGEQKPTLPKWKYKKDNTTLLKDSLVLNKCGHMAKLSSGAIVSDVWVLDYAELAKLPKEEIEKQGEQKLQIEKLPSEMKTIGESLGFTTQEECDEYNEMVTNLIMGDDDKGEQKTALSEEELTDFEKSLKHVMEETLECGDIHNLKADADLLLRLVKPTDDDMKEALRTEYEKGRADAFAQMQKEWSEEDEKMVANLVDYFKVDDALQYTEKQVVDWLKSLKGRTQPQPKQEWSEDDKRILDALITSLINERFAGRLEFLKGIKVSSVIDWLKSLKEKIKGE